MNVTVLAVGNKARHGKDTFARMMQDLEPNTRIVHWADALKVEVMNKERRFPLIYRIMQPNGFYMYYLLDKVVDDQPIYKMFLEMEVPELAKLMDERNINRYWGMDGNGDDDLKDSPMLQFWGTGFRRTYYGNDYWVNIVKQQVLRMQADPTCSIRYVIIPDTRFKNELECVHELGGYFVKIRRYNYDGSLFYDLSRSRFHPSECQLDDVEGDFLIEAKTAEFDVIRNACTQIHNKLTPIGIHAT